MMAVIPQGAWHRLYSSEGATVMSATPLRGENIDLDVDDPRTVERQPARGVAPRRKQPSLNEGEMESRTPSIIGFVKFTFLAPGRVASWAEIVREFKHRSRPDFPLQLFNLTTPAPSTSTSGSTARVVRPRTTSRHGRTISLPTALLATRPRPTSFVCSCTPALIGSYGRCAAPCPNTRS